MPFQSEKQRRYLWANEPEIARDWTDTYGSRIHKAGGGITDMVTVPQYWQSAPNHPKTELAYITNAEKDLLVKKDLHNSLSKGPNVGPGGVMSLNGGDPIGGYGSQGEWGGGNTGTKDTGTGTKKKSFRERITGYKTQKEWQAAKDQRINQRSIDRLRKTRGLYRMGVINRPGGWKQSKLSGRLRNLERQLYGKNYIDYSQNRLRARDLEEVRRQAKITGTDQSMYDEMTGDVAQSKQLANELARRETLQPYEQLTGGKSVIEPSGEVNYAGMFPNFKNIGSNIMKGANWVADRASNIMMNQVPNRFIDYMKGTRGPVTNLTEIAPTRSTQDVLMQGIASNIGRKGYDFSNPFSSVIQSTGGGGEHGPGRTVDYAGYKLGNPLEGGWPGSVGELAPYFNMLGGSAENQIANTLGDYTVNYTPKLDPNHPEVMNVSDIYDFRGKAGEGWGTPYDINVNLSPQMIGKIKGMNYNQGGLASLWPR